MTKRRSFETKITHYDELLVEFELLDVGYLKIIDYTV